MIAQPYIGVTGITSAEDVDRSKALAYTAVVCDAIRSTP